MVRSVIMDIPVLIVVSLTLAPLTSSLFTSSASLESVHEAIITTTILNEVAKGNVSMGTSSSKERSSSTPSYNLPFTFISEKKGPSGEMPEIASSRSSSNQAVTRVSLLGESEHQQTGTDFTHYLDTINQKVSTSLPLNDRMVATFPSTKAFKPDRSVATVFPKSEQMRRISTAETRQGTSNSILEEPTIAPSFNKVFSTPTPSFASISPTETQEDAVSPTTYLDTVGFLDLEMTTLKDYDYLPSIDPMKTPVASSTPPIKLEWSVTTVASTLEQVPGGDTSKTPHSDTASLPLLTEDQTNTMITIRKTNFTEQGGSSTEVTSSLIQVENLTGSTSTKRKVTDLAFTTDDCKNISMLPRNDVASWIYFVFAPIIAMIVFLCLCYFKRKYTHYGQYKLVSKPIWVSNPDTLKMDEIHV